MVGGLLLLLVEDVNVPAGLVCTIVSGSLSSDGGREKHTGSIRSVVAATVSTQGVDLGDLLGSELDLLEVVANARGSHRLGDDTATLDLGPGEDDVGTGDLSAGTLGDGLGDLLDLRAGDQERDVKHVVTESLLRLAFA